MRQQILAGYVAAASLGLPYSVRLDANPAYLETCYAIEKVISMDTSVYFPGMYLPVLAMGITAQTVVYLVL